jgi:hypothetical protein
MGSYKGVARGVFADIIAFCHSHILGRSPKEQTSQCHLVRGFHFGNAVTDHCFVENLDSQPVKRVIGILKLVQASELVRNISGDRCAGDFSLESHRVWRVGRGLGNQRKIEFRWTRTILRRKNEKGHNIHNYFDDSDGLLSRPGPVT